METISLGWSTLRIPTPTLPPQGTSACPAASADTKHGGGILQSRRRGFQHSLHVLVFRCILSIAQTLGLARCCWRAAGELARLQDQSEVRTWGRLSRRPPSFETVHSRETLSPLLSLCLCAFSISWSPVSHGERQQGHRSLCKKI